MEMHFNGLTPAEAERLALLAEELGETTHAIGRILRHGYESKNPYHIYGPTNREALEREVADVYVAIRMMFEAGDIRRMACATHEDIKTEAVKKYLHHQTRNDQASGARSVPLGAPVGHRFNQRRDQWQTHLTGGSCRGLTGLFLTHDAG